MIGSATDLVMADARIGTQGIWLGISETSTRPRPASRQATVTKMEVDQLLRAEDVGRSWYATTGAIRSRMRQEKRKAD
jgi:hypothetical protein